MTTDSSVVDATGGNEQEIADAIQDVQIKMAGQPIEEQLAAQREINKNLIKTRDAAKARARELEKMYAEFETIKKEGESSKALAATLKEKLVSRAINDSLKAELTKAGALSVDTALKLVDKSKIVFNDEYELDSKSIENLVSELKKSDSILFKPDAAADEKEDKPVKHSSIGRPGEGVSSETAYEVEMNNAKTQAQVEAIMRKFNKI